MRYYKLASIFLATVFACTTNAAPLVLIGSDVIGSSLKDELLKMSEKDGLELKVDMKGSFTALDNLKEGKGDVAIIGMKEQKVPEGYTAIPFAYQAAIVVVNVVNPLEEISTASLRNIFSKTTADRIENWEQLGVRNVGNMRSILPLVTSFSDNIVLELFKYSVMPGDNIAPWVNVVPKKSDIFNIIKTNNSAIAIIGKIPTDQSVIKVLAVSENTKGVEKGYAFKPEHDTLYNNDYPMSLPFYIVYKTENVAKVRGLIRMLFDDQIARVLESADFFSVPKNFRKKSVLELDMAK